MSYKELFCEVPEYFMGEFILTINAGVNSNSRVQGLSVDQFTGGRFTNVGPDRRIRLHPPFGYAYFSQVYSAPFPKLLPFLREGVQIDIGNNSNHAVPVYIIPYDANKGLGVKLPAAQNIFSPDAYALTATTTGCTVHISGDAEEPFVSHSNVRNTNQNDKANEMARHLERLQYRFMNRYINYRGENNETVWNNRLQLGWHPNVNDDFIGDEINYRDLSQNILEDHIEFTENHSIKKSKKVKKIYQVPFTDFQIEEIRSGDQSCRTSVIARRREGLWTFYYQIVSYVEFYINEMSFKGKQLMHKEILNPDTNKPRHAGSVIVAYGKLWPETTCNPVRFEVC